MKPHLKNIFFKAKNDLTTLTPGSQFIFPSFLWSSRFFCNSHEVLEYHKLLLQFFIYQNQMIQYYPISYSMIIIIYNIALELGFSCYKFERLSPKSKVFA
jgi:hypothetical protein